LSVFVGFDPFLSAFIGLYPVLSEWLNLTVQTNTARRTSPISRIAGNLDHKNASNPGALSYWGHYTKVL
jgi:hypothetical protein